MKKSLNQIRVELKEIATAHLQINSFFWGDLEDALSDHIIYPLMNCYFTGNGSSFEDNTTTISIVVEICDRLYKDDSNLNDVESDIVQISRDIFNVVNKSTRWKKLGIVQNSIATKFKHGTPDVVACVSNNISFKLRDVSGVCDLPIQDYDFDQSIDPSCIDPSNCPVVTVDDGGNIVEVPSGDIYTCVGSVPIGGSAMPFEDGTGTSTYSRPFYTLPIIDSVQQLNHYGSKWRITGTTGGVYDRDTLEYKDVNGLVTTRALAYPDDLICDWSTFMTGGNFLMFNNNDTYIVAPLATATTTLSTATIGSFTGFRVATIKEGQALQNPELARSIGYIEFYNTAAVITLNTITPWLTNVHGLYSNYGDVIALNPLAGNRNTVVRTTNISELP